MDILICVITVAIVAILSVFRYAALTIDDFKGIKRKQLVFALAFGLLFGMPGYYFFVEKGNFGAAFICFSLSFLGSSIGLEINRFIEKRSSLNKQRLPQ